MNTRFDELLPFYVNDTLSPDDRAWFEAYLREHPAANEELHWVDSLQARLREDVPAVSSEVGMERVLRRIRSEHPAPQRPRQSAQRSTLQRAREWLASLVPQPMLRPAFAAALAVVVAQGAVIAMLVGQHDDDSQIRALQATVVDHGPYLKVNFKPDARETDIRLLLVKVNGSLAAGPGQLGDYYVRVPEEHIAAAQQAIAGSTIVDGVAVVDALPARR